MCAIYYSATGDVVDFSYQSTNKESIYVGKYKAIDNLQIDLIHILIGELMDGVTVTTSDEEPLYIVPTVNCLPEPQENAWSTNPCIHCGKGKAKKIFGIVIKTITLTAIFMPILATLIIGTMDIQRTKHTSAQLQLVMNAIHSELSANYSLLMKEINTLKNRLNELTSDTSSQLQSQFTQFNNSAVNCDTHSDPYRNCHQEICSCFINGSINSNKRLYCSTEYLQVNQTVSHA